MQPVDENVPGPRPLVDALRTEVAQLQRQVRSRDLARVAVSQLAVDPERALLLVLEASAAAVTFESRDALQQAVSASRVRWAFGNPGEANIGHAYFAKDNRHIVTAGQDCVLRWWDLDARKEITALACCDGILEGFHPSPARDRALVTVRTGPSGKFQRILVDLSERQVLTSLADDALTEYDVHAVAVFFSQHGGRLALSWEDGTAFTLWDSTSGVRLFAAADVGRCHGLDQEGRRALLTRPDCSVVVLHLEGDGHTTSLTLPDNVTMSDLNAGPIPFSADGTCVTAGTSDRVACVWDARDGRLLHILGEQCPCHRSTAGFSPSGHWLVVQQNDSVSTEIWDAQSGKLQGQLLQSSAFHVPLRFLPYPARPEGEYAVVGMGASRYSWPLPVDLLSEWNLTTGAVRSQFRLAAKTSFQRCFTADGVAVHCGLRTEQDDISLDTEWVLRLVDGIVRVYAREEFDAPEKTSDYGRGHTADRGIGYTEGGRTLVNSRTNEELAPLGTYERYLFSPDGRYLVALSHAGDKPVIPVWDARTGSLRFAIDAYDRQITTMQFQPGNGLLLIVSVDHTIRLWSLETGAEVARATPDAPDAPSYEASGSPDGTKVAWPTSGRLHVWHVDRGEIVHAPTTLYAKDPRFSADGRWLLAGDEDVARIWDATTMEGLGEFPWHFAMVLSGDLSPDKRLAATYGMDRYVRLWEAPGGREITHWKIPEEPLCLRRPLRFAEDGDTLYSPNDRRLLVDVERLISLAKTRAFRELGQDERRLFLGEKGM
jgi:WD40 repeat protein